ncbi:hypothetical protein ACX9NE_24200 [Mycobacterium sp. ML4]
MTLALPQAPGAAIWWKGHLLPGIVARASASRVDGLWAKATSSANTAKTWAIAGAVLAGLILLSCLGRLGSHVS